MVVQHVDPTSAEGSGRWRRRALRQSRADIVPPRCGVLDPALEEALNLRRDARDVMCQLGGA